MTDCTKSYLLHGVTGAYHQSFEMLEFESLGKKDEAKFKRLNRAPYPKEFPYKDVIKNALPHQKGMFKVDWEYWREGPWSLAKKIAWNKLIIVLLGLLALGCSIPDKELAEILIAGSVGTLGFLFCLAALTASIGVAIAQTSQTLLDASFLQEDAKALITHIFRKSFPSKKEFWIKLSPDGYSMRLRPAHGWS